MAVKTCKVCDTEKPEEEFYLYKRKGTRDSYCTRCRILYNREYVKNNPERIERLRKRWDQKNPNYNKEYLRRPHIQAKREPHRKKMKLKKYGLTEEQYQELFEQQNGQCAICKSPLIIHGRDTHTDHCHTTSRVRGILCLSCNTGLGHFKDNIERLRRAISYLEMFLTCS